MLDPPAPIAGFLSAPQRRVLHLVCETICPALEPPPGTAPRSSLSAYWQRPASSLHGALLVEAALDGEVRPDEQARLRLALWTLDSPPACLWTSGDATPFSRRSAAGRESLLRAWSVSPLPLIRQAFQTFKRLAAFFFYATPTPDGPNPNAEVLSYPDPWQPPAQPAPPANPARPLQPLPITEDTVLEADACVVGSGAGGGVVAALLAAAGYRVVVLEAGEGGLEPTFGGDELAGFQHLYAKRGLLTNEDAGVSILAGRTVGGGTTVNWMTCFRPPRRVLEEWAAASGLSGLLEPALQDSLDAVEARIHVTGDESHLNPNNAALLRGAQALGWHAAIQPRNARGCGDCGHCSFGCPWGAKQGTLRTYLQDAADAGAQLVASATAERVLFEGTRAVGVEARVRPPGVFPRGAAPPGTHRLLVRAPLVIVAAGGIESPALLLRSGLRHPLLGRNLYLHPSTVVFGRFTETIAPWAGPLQTVHSDQFADLDGNGYGFKLEVTPVYPGLAATALPWEGGRAFKERMLHIKHGVSVLVLSRDTAGGRVTVDRWGNPRIEYRLSRANARYLLRGCTEGARLLLAAGANEAETLHTRTTNIVRPASGAMPSAAAWARYDTAVAQHGAGANLLGAFSAHQMGTCRMAARPDGGVVDGNGAVWGTTGLYVADTSLFPRPSGVNPMITVMGLGHRIGTQLAAR